MDIFLVGGAVRDSLLGIPITERDWVVVGASADQMRALGYTQVGQDFPVFLHPQTKEEYALARTERKRGSGHHGFECRFDLSVTLEQDLARRDLTINAIAQDPDGQLIDPYGGQRDLNARVLRHVTDAFSEDPLRVLRVARFAAKLRPYDFTLDPSTLSLSCALLLPQVSSVRCHPNACGESVKRPSKQRHRVCSGRACPNAMPYQHSLTEPLVWLGWHLLRGSRS